MQISTLPSMLHLMLRLVPAATAPLVAGKWSEMFGNGRPPISYRFPDLAPTPMKIIRSRGLASERYCAAAVGHRAHGLAGAAIGITFICIALSYLPVPE